MVTETWFVLLVQLLLAVVSINSSVMILPSFSWDPRNKIFSGQVCGGTEKFAHIVVQEGSEIYFLCSSAAILSSIQRNFAEQTNMYENMYLVTENEFHRCQIDGTTQNTKKVMDCNTPINNYALKYHRFWFSDFTTPNGIPFYAGSTYYFIATSNGSASSLDNTSGGRCLTHNMRVAITVCPASQKCIKDDTLCKTPKTVELPTTTTTTTTTIPPPSSEPSTISTTEKSGGKGDEEPKVQAQHREPSSSGNSGFGLIGVLCLVGGLLAGFLCGVIAVILAQRYHNQRLEQKEKDFKGDFLMEEKTKDNTSLRNIEDNKAYRYSMEGKRLLSTSSNASNDRYSVVPPAAVIRNPPPPGTIAV